jgi:hypothetical protein
MAKTADLAVAFVSRLCLGVQSNREGSRLGNNAVCTDRRICAERDWRHTPRSAF